ncbi:MAG: hypothetical protein Q9222_000363 [Ikaeria aurantiellina]
MTHAANIRTGRFTSPHLIDRWDCITVDEKVVEQSAFDDVAAAVRHRDIQDDIKASEFELLTATAFKLFAQEKVEIGVIEVGLGGRLDATNVLEHPLVTVITKIGEDHQSLLGKTIEEIAGHKAGIMKSGVPCIVDATNPTSVHSVLDTTAQQVGAGPLFHVSSEAFAEDGDLQAFLAKTDLEHHQRMNFYLAYCAAKIAVRQLAPTVLSSTLLAGAGEAAWPGRLQTINIAGLTGRKEPVLLDGAHNAQSAEALALFVKERIRTQCQPITWIIAVSRGKNIESILSPLIKSIDNIIAVAFGPVDGMPWISPAEPGYVLAEARSLGVAGLLKDTGRDVRDALALATSIAAGAPIVVGGSLLTAPPLRLVEDSAKYVNTEGSILVPHARIDVLDGSTLAGVREGVTSSDLQRSESRSGVDRLYTAPQARSIQNEDHHELGNPGAARSKTRENQKTKPSHDVTELKDFVWLPGRTSSTQLSTF